MKRIPFFLLLALLLGVCWWLWQAGENRWETTLPQTVLWPESEGIEQISQVKIAVPGRAPVVICQTERGEWVVENCQRYPAEVSRLRSLLLHLNTARVVEEGKSEELAVAGLQEGKATEVSFLKADGTEMAHFLFGYHADRRERDGMEGRGGGARYVAFQGRHLLVLHSFAEVDVPLLEWLQDAGELWSLARPLKIEYAAEGENWILSRKNVEAPWELEGEIPAGQTLDEAKLSELWRALRQVTFRSVRRAVETERKILCSWQVEEETAERSCLTLFVPEGGKVYGRVERKGNGEGETGRYDGWEFEFSAGRLLPAMLSRRALLREEPEAPAAPQQEIPPSPVAVE